MSYKLIEKVEEKQGTVNIPYHKYELDNGLNVVIHQDHSTPLVHVDITYHVGSGREEIVTVSRILRFNGRLPSQPILTQLWYHEWSLNAMEGGPPHIYGYAQHRKSCPSGFCPNGTAQSSHAE